MFCNLDALTYKLFYFVMFPVEMEMRWLLLKQDESPFLSWRRRGYGSMTAYFIDAGWFIANLDQEVASWKTVVPFPSAMWR